MDETQAAELMARMLRGGTTDAARREMAVVDDEDLAVTHTRLQWLAREVGNEVNRRKLARPRGERP